MREILDKERLRAVPCLPGVYVMSGRVTPHAEPVVLYVGKSINLRRRLASYRSISSDRASARLVRLAYAVESVTWETCADDHEARLRENFLLRLHRPKFNSASTHPESHRFVVLRTGENAVELDWVSEPNSHGECFGAFKHAAGFLALQRALWVALHPPEAAPGLPASSFGVTPLTPVRFTWLPSLGNTLEFQTLCLRLRAYFAGSSLELVDWLRERLRAAMAQSRFAQIWLNADLQTLEDFFAHTTNRLAALRRRFGIAGTVLRNTELDDLLALSQATHAAQNAAKLRGRD
jgi:hypothetical protein